MSRLRVEQLRRGDVGPVSLTVEPGECIAVSGPSGAGKTVLLRAIADLDPHDGQAYLDDAACGAMSAPAWRRRVGLLPSESQWWHDRVGDHFPPLDTGVLEALGFTPDILDRAVRGLSTGERQRLALIRLLANRPQALLLDEPTASLDPASVGRVEAVIAAYRAEHRCPVLWVSHDPEQIRRIAGRHYRIAGGRLEQAA